MKTLIGNIQRFSTEDGPGIRTTVFVKGCPLSCLWCHNPEMINPFQQMIISPSRCIGCEACVDSCPNHGITVTEQGPQIDWGKCEACGECMKMCYAKAISAVGREMSSEEVMEEVIKDKGFYEKNGGGVTLSGGEILTQSAFAHEMIELCGREGINVCLDTCGYAEYGLIHDLAAKPNVQYLLFDIKHMDEEKHRKFTGVSNSLILENLEKLAADSAVKDKLWMRMPLIEGVNDDSETIERTGELFSRLGLKRLTLIGYHELGKSKAEHTGMEHVEFKPPSEERLDEIKKYFENIGMQVEITGSDERLL